MESDDLLFPIEEVVDNASVENIKSESGNIMNHAIYVHLCSILLYQKKGSCHMVQLFTLTGLTKVTMKR